jgi:predicted exporter
MKKNLSSSALAALTQVGVHKDQVIKYEAGLKVDKYLLVVHGSAEDQEKARSMLA